MRGIRVGTLADFVEYIYLPTLKKKVLVIASGKYQWDGTCHLPFHHHQLLFTTCHSPDCLFPFPTWPYIFSSMSVDSFPSAVNSCISLCCTDTSPRQAVPHQLKRNYTYSEIVHIIQYCVNSNLIRLVRFMGKSS